MKIISLDLGTTTAWCIGDLLIAGPVPEWGCWRLAGASRLDQSFVGLYNELWDLVEATNPEYVVYETPLSQSTRDNSRNIVDLLVGLAAVTRLVCTLLSVPVYEQTFAEVRKLVIGKGTFPQPFRGHGKLSKRTGKLVGDAKEEVRLWTERYGWPEIDDPDARDAALLFRYAQMIYQPANSQPKKNTAPGANEPRTTAGG
jgi:hypothetical protein